MTGRLLFLTILVIAVATVLAIIAATGLQALAHQLAAAYGYAR